MENKIKALGLLSLIAVAAVIGGILMTAKADDNSTTTTTTSTATNTIIPPWNCSGMGFGRHGGMGFGGPRGPGGFGGFGQFEISADFTANVTNIAKADSDVQNLLANGYNITVIRPIIKTVIDAQGNVAAKATSAVLMLQKDTPGLATVTVNIEEAKVTQIVILTRTVIEK